MNSASSASKREHQNNLCKLIKQIIRCSVSMKDFKALLRWAPSVSLLRRRSLAPHAFLVNWGGAKRTSAEEASRAFAVGEYKWSLIFLIDVFLPVLIKLTKLIRTYISLTWRWL